jgi:hypothetical protein
MDRKNKEEEKGEGEGKGDEDANELLKRQEESLHKQLEEASKTSLIIGYREIS